MASAEKRKRSTVYLEHDLHKALKIKAAETSSNLSELVNGAVRDSLREDLDDLACFDKRAAEPTLSFQDLLKRLNLDGKI